MYECGELEVGVASGSGWNLWVRLLGVVVRSYIDFLILLIPTPLFFFAATSRGGSRIECRGVLSIPRALARAKFYVLRPLLTSFPHTIYYRKKK